MNGSMAIRHSKTRIQISSVKQKRSIEKHSTARLQKKGQFIGARIAISTLK
jgi:hypothetical protein